MLLKQLREATASSHQDLETEIDLVANLRTPDTWRWLLETFYGYFVPVEALIFTLPALSEWLPDLHDRRKSDALIRDVNTLGGNAKLVQTCAHLPQIHSLAEGFGVLYVLEGATLGGRVISQLAAHQNYTAKNGCAYFSSYGENVGSMWGTFCVRLNAYQAAHSNSSEVIVRSAIETFTKFQAWVSRRKLERVEL